MIVCWKLEFSILRPEVLEYSEYTVHWSDHLLVLVLVLVLALALALHNKYPMDRRKKDQDTKLPWAEVLKRSTARRVPNVENNGFVSRLFSRNNPDNRTEV